MTPEQTNELALRYKHIWRGGPELKELRRAFTNVHAEVAHTVIDRLAQTCEHPPSIARIISECHALQRALNPPSTQQPLPDIDRSVPYRTGVMIARQAYIVQCQWDGREPDLEAFNRRIKRLAGENPP